MSSPETRKHMDTKAKSVLTIRESKHCCQGASRERKSNNIKLEAKQGLKMEERQTEQFIRRCLQSKHKRNQKSMRAKYNSCSLSSICQGSVDPGCGRAGIDSPPAKLVAAKTSRVRQIPSREARDHKLEVLWVDGGVFHHLFGR